MALNDIKVQDTGGLGNLTTTTHLVSASATLIYAGEPVKLTAQTGGAASACIKLADADGVIGTTTQILGIAASTSTNTASADGTVDVYRPIQSTIFRAKAKSSTAANTAAKITALLGAMCLIDLTSSTFTIDTAVTSNTYGFQIVGGDPNTNEVYFQIRQSLLTGLTS